MSFAPHRPTRRRTSRPAPSPAPLVEPLEPRALLAAAPVPDVLATVDNADPDDQTSVFQEELATDDRGNVYVAGQFVGTIDVDPDPSQQHTLTSTSGPNALDTFFAKYDSRGSLLWAHQFDAHTPKIAVTSDDDVYLALGFGGTLDADPGEGTHDLTAASGNGELAVIRFDSFGQFVTAAKFRTRRQSMMPVGIGADAQGRVYVAAQSFIIPTPQKPDDYDTVLWGLTENLEYRYGHRWGAKDHQMEPRDLAVNPDGSVFIAGMTWTGVDFHPARRKLRRVPDGFQNRNSFLLRVNPRGQFDWVIGLSGPDYTSQEFTTLAPDGSGGVYVSGVFGPEVDFNPARRKVFSPDPYQGRFRDAFVARYTARAALDKFWSLGEAGDMYEPMSLAVDPDSGNLAVAGSLQTQSWEQDSTSGQRLTGSGAFFATYTPTGTLLGSRAVPNAWLGGFPAQTLIPAFAGGALYLLGRSEQPVLPTYAPGESDTSIDIHGGDVYVLKVA